MVGTLFTTIATVEIEGAQGEFEILHWKTLVPTASPVMEVVGDNEFVIVPLPEIKLQLPIPEIAVLAFIVVIGVEIQMV